MKNWLDPEVLKQYPSGSLMSCDVFSTYRDGTPSGKQEFPVIDTVTWDYICIR